MNTFVNKFDNLNEMNKLLERYKSSKLIQEKIENPLSPISVKEIEFLISI